MNQPITDLFFDLDHTLWDFDANSAIAFAVMLEEFNIPLPLQDFLEVYIPINNKFWEDYTLNKISAADLKTGRLRETFTLFSITYHETELVKMSTVYLRELTKNNQLFEDAIPTLQYLYGNYRMHIITNGFSAEQHIKIQKSGLHSFFQTITTSDETGVKKPNPIIFKEAMHKAKADPIKAVMIGDNFQADILGADGVGMHTIHYDYHKEQIPEKFQQISTLAELKNFF